MEVGEGKNLAATENIARFIKSTATPSMSIGCSKIMCEGLHITGSSRGAESWYQREVGLAGQIYSLWHRASKAPKMNIDQPIVFTIEGREAVSYPHHNLMVITLAIANSNMHRTFVDGTVQSCFRDS